jgi:aspartyl-tRNA(Asn)/glutamyl-tRNA(Gln) amidotransferase subunit C
MQEAITPELFDYLVELAALELTSDEAQYLRRELNQQLKAIQELERIVVGDDVPAAARGVAYPPEVRAALREDVPVPSDLATTLLSGAPDFDDGYFIVPEIPHQDL